MKESICLALGFFDSVHYGHRVILQKLKDKANLLEVKPYLSTFTDSFCKLSEKLVYTYSERKNILSGLAINNILLFEFSGQFKKQTPDGFLNSLLQSYDPKYIVCGYDYRFGRGGRGDINTLNTFCGANSIELEVIDKVSIAGERVSSSKIKQLLTLGDIENANKMLVSEYFIIGKVEKGRGEGKKNSIPTANITLPEAKLIPKCGVYATKTVCRGKIYNSVTSIGQKPTYGDYSFSVETFIDEFSDDIYGEEIRIIFYKYLRCTEKFASKKELAEQIKSDMNTSKRLTK